MKTKLIYYLCPWIFIFATHIVMSQDISGYLESSDKAKYNEIKESLKEADALYKEAQSAGGRKAYKLYKNACKIYDINYRQLYMLGAPYLEKYTEETEGEKHKKIRVLNYTASDNIAMGITERRKAASADKDQATKFYKKAHEYNKKAEEALYKAFGVYHGDEAFELPEKDPYTVAALEKRKEFAEQNFSENSFEPTPDAVRKTPVYKKQTAIATADTKHTYSVQIAASKKKDNIAYLQKKYPKAGTIREEYSDGYYKYTYGSYNTYREATEASKNSGVRGAFVVAYYNNKRLRHITDVLLPPEEKVFEAGDGYQASNSQKQNDHQSGNENTTHQENKQVQNSPTGIEYRIQIGISRIPASDSQLRRMNKTNLPVKTWKGGSTYRYTIGSFKTEQEALNFKNANGLTKTFVVKYKNGRQVN